MKKRNLPLCVIFTIITFGIYGIYWFIVMTDEVNYLAEEDDATSGGMSFLFTLITCGIYSIYWAYKMGEKISKIKQKRDGVMPTNDSIIYLILSIFGLSIINYVLIQNEVNKTLDSQVNFRV